MTIHLNFDELHYPKDSDDIGVGDDDDDDEDEGDEIHDYRRFDNHRETVEEILVNTTCLLTWMGEVIARYVQMFFSQYQNMRILVYTIHLTVLKYGNIILNLKTYLLYGTVVFFK